MPEWAPPQLEYQRPPRSRAAGEGLGEGALSQEAWRTQRKHGEEQREASVPPLCPRRLCGESVFRIAYFCSLVVDPGASGVIHLRIASIAGSRPAA